MQHPGFFQREGPYPLKVIAEATGAELLDLCDGEKEIDDLRPLHQAAGTSSHLLRQPQICRPAGGNARRAPASSSAATPSSCPRARPRSPPRSPHRAFAIAVGLLYPEALQPTATASGGERAGQLIHPTAEIAEGVRIEPGAVDRPRGPDRRRNDHRRRRRHRLSRLHRSALLYRPGRRRYACLDRRPGDPSCRRAHRPGRLRLSP